MAHSNPSPEHPDYTEDQYTAVPTASLIHRKTSLSDLFVRLPSDRMVKVAHKGGAIDTERITRFGDRDVQYLYVNKSDLGDIVSDLVRGAEGLNQLPNVPTDLKVAKFFNIAESVFSELLKLPLTDESVGRAVRLSQEIATSMREKPDFLKLVTTVVSLGDEFTRHSLGTVLMANMLMTKLDWSSPKLVAPITAGAFFHDIGLKEIPAELRFKNRIDMTPDEALMWECHPAKGVQLLSPLHSMTADVLRIVQEHHEIPNGQGFPGKLRLDRIFPMAKVVSLSNLMAHDVFDVLQTPNDPFPLDTFTQKVEHIYSVMYGSDLARAARLIFRADDK
jgi:HD-GYP domain-containing protein (c-di-GMP phosphodiesterase class II)